MTLEGPQHSGKSPRPQVPSAGHIQPDDIALPPSHRTSGAGASPAHAPVQVPSSVPPATPPAPLSAGKPPRGPFGRRFLPLLMGLLIVLGFGLSWFSLRSIFKGRDDAQISLARQQHYAAREAQAPADQREQLKALRNRVAKRNLKFTVGYTSVMAYDLRSVTGLVPPADIDEQILAQAAINSQGAERENDVTPPTPAPQPSERVAAPDESAVPEAATPDATPPEPAAAEPQKEQPVEPEQKAEAEPPAALSPRPNNPRPMPRMNQASIGVARAW